MSQGLAAFKDSTAKNTGIIKKLQKNRLLTARDGLANSMNGIPVLFPAVIARLLPGFCASGASRFCPILLS